MLDNAVGGGPGTGAEEEVLDIFQTSRSSIQQVLGIAVSPDPTTNLHLLHVEWQLTLRIVKRECRLGKGTRFTTGRAIEDDIGHLFATQAFCRLVPKNPLHGVDDIALTAPVRSYNAVNPR